MKQLIRNIIRVSIVSILIIACAVLCVFSFTVYPYTLRNTIFPPRFNLSSWVNTSNCPVCSHEPVDPPHLLNISTGKLSEIRIYPRTTPTESNDISPPNTPDGLYGVMTTIHGVGFSGYATPDNGHAEITVDTNYWDPCNPYVTSSILCNDCLNKLQELDPVSNHVFIDLFNSHDGIVTYYDIKPNSEFTIRHYTVSVNQIDSYNKLNIEINSNYFTGGDSLDTQ